MLDYNDKPNFKLEMRLMQFYIVLSLFSVVVLNQVVLGSANMSNIVDAQDLAITAVVLVATRLKDLFEYYSCRGSS